MSKRLKNSFLALIIIIAISLRFIGIKPGYHQFHSDENTIYSTASTFIKNRNFEPFHYEYPSLTNYLNFIAFKFFFIPLGWLNFYVKNITQILDGQIKLPLGKDIYNRVFQLEILGSREINALFWARWVTASFAVGIVLLSYVIGRKLFGEKVGLITAFLVSINYRQVLNAHLGLPDIYNAFFLLLSFWSILHLRDKITTKRALTCGLFLGLYFSTKYQIFPFFTLLFIFLEKVFQKQTSKGKFYSLFDPCFILIPITALTIFLLLNPYFFINLETAVSQLSYASLKYRVGINKFMLYPYWYLFNIGLGKITFIATLVGVLVISLKERKKSLLLLSVIFPFFYFMTFYTGGGFYTRNFVSITPFLLILTAYFLVWLFSLKPKVFFLFFTIIVLFLAVWENLSNSLIVIKEYAKPWNHVLISRWLEKEIPKGKIVAGHSSVPLPSDVIRIDYDYPSAFSLAEFQEAKVDYAVINLDWVSVFFYDWMNSLVHWNKPISEMKKSYPALTIDELTDFGLHQEVNPWQAPDSNFIAVKIPYYSLKSEEKIKSFGFEEKIPITGWNSEPLEIQNLSGFVVNYELRLETKKKDDKAGIVFVKFYSDVTDAKEDKNPLAVRLSPRIGGSQNWVEKELIGTILPGATFATVNFQVLDVNSAIGYLKRIEFFQAEVSEDLEKRMIGKIKLDENIIFPNSHGNL